MITKESEEMYLETIYIISEKTPCFRSVDIADKLGYSRPSVSRAVGLLKDKGFITVGKGGKIALTEAGRAKAEGVYERHKVITKILVRFGAEESVAEENACRIEHVVTDELFETLKKFADKI